MKLLISGSRSITEFDLSPYIGEDVDALISGGAVDIDRLAEEYADKHRLSKYIVRPQYKIYGRGAPLKRNEMMVDMADAVLIIWDGRSRGALYTKEYAVKKNKLVTFIGQCDNPLEL